MDGFLKIMTSKLEQKIAFQNQQTRAENCLPESANII